MGSSKRPSLGMTVGGGALPSGRRFVKLANKTRRQTLPRHPLDRPTGSYVERSVAVMADVIRRGLNALTCWKAPEMDEGEIEAQSFVVKVWLEEIDSTTGRRVWRGRVTHVPSGEQHAFTELVALVGILGAYLEGTTP